MEQPKGFVKEGENGKKLVCKLKRSLYGLKQSARCWFQKLYESLMERNYQQCPSDPCLFWKKIGNDILYLSVYVDDILMVSNSRKFLDSEKIIIGNRFPMHDLGNVNYILGVKIIRDRKNRRMWLSQEGYIQEVLKKFKMESCKPVSTPADTDVKLPRNDGSAVNQVEYQSLVGSLIYAAIGTRPDIAQAVGMVSQHNSNPGIIHWTAAKRILRYLNGTRNYSLKFEGTREPGIELYGYTDADWGSFDLVNRKSQSGYGFYIAGGLISWTSRKQATVALSTTEAEYMAVSLACQELIWIRRVIGELGFIQKDATILYEDNIGAIETTKNPKFHGRMKHIDLRHHFIRDHVEKGTVSVEFCPTENQIADIFTKPLTREKFEKFRTEIGIGPLESEESK